MRARNCYFAPELFTRNAKFTKKTDHYAAGIIFLELVALRDAEKLIDSWPLIEKSTDCPALLRACLASTLDEDPTKRTSFSKLLVILREGREEMVSIPESFYFSNGNGNIRVRNK
jgi:serine/threonine protein kinase